MGNSSLLDRRRFLLGVVPAVTVGTLGVTSCSNKIPTATPSSYAPTYFNNAEWTFINAAVGRLIPSEGPGPGGVEAGVPEFIDRQMEMPYGHGAYFYLKGPFLGCSADTGLPASIQPARDLPAWHRCGEHGEPEIAGQDFAQFPPTPRIDFSPGWKRSDPVRDSSGGRLLRSASRQHQGRLLRRSALRRQPRHGRLEMDRLSRGACGLH